MSKKVVRYQEWMDAMIALSDCKGASDEELDRAVREALAKLSDSEKELMERRFLMGQSCRLMSAELNFTERELERLLRETTLKLKRLLAPYVLWRFKLQAASQTSCLICESAERKTAEEIIASKKKEETWKRVIRELHERLDLKINSPQILIGHVKYHLSLDGEAKRE